MPEAVDGLNRAQRYQVTVFIGQGEEAQPFGRTRDLSVTGLFLETDARPSVDSLQEIAVVWGEDTLICSARVVRHAADGVGLMFVNPDPSFMGAIEDIIQASPKTPAPRY